MDWKLDQCKFAAVQYKSKIEWKMKDHKSYEAARKNKWIKECSEHMVRPQVHNKKWDFESCKIESLKHKTRGKWQAHHASSYQIAQRNGWLEECCSHMSNARNLNNTWTLDRCKLEALKYTTRSEWWRTDGKSYDAARSKNFLEDCCAHMPKRSHSSMQENIILSIVKNKFPLACSRKFGKNKKFQSGNRFELDIYIPELNKGIEFNGEYWHREGLLRKGKDPAKYHSLKRDFFKKLSIDYIEIWENEWAKNKDLCLLKINDFLGVSL